jgi:hypothetical protein
MYYRAASKPCPKCHGQMKIAIIDRHGREVEMSGGNLSVWQCQECKLRENQE